MQKTKEELMKDFKKFLIDNDIKLVDIASVLGCSRATITQKNANFSWRYIDLVNLLDKLGYDVVWVKRESSDSQTNVENGIVQK